MSSRRHHAAALLGGLVALGGALAHADVSALHPGPVEVFVPRADLSDRLHEHTGGHIHNDNGKHIIVRWHPPGFAGDWSLVFRTQARSPDPAAVRAIVGTAPEVGTRFGDWTLIAITEDAELVDEVGQEPGQEVGQESGQEPGQEPGPDGAYTYLVMTARPSFRDLGRVIAISEPSVSEPITPRIAFFDIDRWFFLSTIALMAAALFIYTRRVRSRPEDVYIRRIPGVDAIEEAVGRSTEMGRPVLYVTGTEEIQNIQTIASLLILGHVAEMTAEYDTEIKVANFFPLTMVVAEEIVKQGYANAGRIDAHKPENVMFISAEQFAFAAGVNGLILRDRPATNIYLGRFFAESLILAETGYVTRAIQIAGTAEITQLPFFIAACDYTIIGEELYAVSAYLSREPSLLATLKSTDAVKVIIIVLMLVGALGATAGWFELGPWLMP
jgi:hypothetical protein